jgi:hypothetical protein
MEQLDIPMAVRVYREIGDAAMVRIRHVDG